ncbi:MAG: YHYH protein [Pseudomonadota bacterium]
MNIQSKPSLARPSWATLSLVSCAALTLTAISSQAMAASNSVSIKVVGNQRCMQSNGIPNHRTGTFPNRGNPHRISTQRIKLCVSTNPRKGSRARAVRGTVGFALNGIILRPGTADYYDPSSRRGFSRNRSSGWNLEGLGARDKLGMDSNNAHVDNRGIYHYHGPSAGMRRSAKGTLVGYAADGHEIHYLGSRVKSSYRLKSGTRPSGPGGRYDGTYNEDWAYVAGSGNLDRCNGGTLNGKYVYFATNQYPFFPRCVYGRIGSGFQALGGGGRGRDGVRPQRRNRQHARAGDGQRRLGNRGQRRSSEGRRRGPPQVAINACQSRASGNRCSFRTPRNNRRISGTCRMTREQVRACVPSGGRAPRG